MSVTGTPHGAAADILGEWQNLLRPLMSSTPEPLVDSMSRIASASDAILGSPYSLITVADEAGDLQFFQAGDAEDKAAQALRSLAAREDVRARVLGEGTSIRSPGRSGLEAELLGGQAVIGSALGVPITYEGRTVGGLYLGRPPDARAFSSSELQMAQLVAGAAAAILRRTRLTQDFRWQQKWLTEAAQLTRSVLAGEHRPPTRLIVERVREMTQADVVAVVRHRPDDDTHQMVDAVGDIEPYLDGRRIDVRAAVLAPMTGPALGRGALALFPRSSGRPFTPAEIEATKTLAGQVSVALDLAQSRTDRERLSLLDERDRIARDLHDHVIQRLFAIGLTVHSVATQLDGPVADRLLAGVDDLDETIEQIRSTIYRLRGPVLPVPKSIPMKVAELVEEMAPVLGFPAELEIHGPVEFGVDDEVSDDCIAVLREALTNVARHAHATRARVSLSVESSMLTLLVIDNGSGVGAAARRSGLANLRARAERRGGEMSLTPGDGGGTQLTWTIPLPGSSSGGAAGRQPAAASSDGG